MLIETSYAGYVDDASDNRTMAGGVLRFALTPRVRSGRKWSTCPGDAGRTK
jgi:hypothetical protein